MLAGLRANRDNIELICHDQYVGFILKTYDFQCNVTMTQAVSARIMHQKYDLLEKPKQAFGRRPWSIGLAICKTSFGDAVF